MQRPALRKADKSGESANVLMQEVASMDILLWCKLGQPCPQPSVKEGYNLGCEKAHSAGKILVSIAKYRALVSRMC
jgi:hypothetical protein